MFQKETIDTTRNWCKDADPFGQAENTEEYWYRVNKGLNMLNRC